MQLYATMGERLVKLLAPDYVWIAEDADHQEHIHRQEVLAHYFDTIYWANYYCPGYLDKNTEKLFLNAPVGLVQHLEGGIWYQLHKNFETISNEEATRIEEEVKSYFSELNLGRVQWRYMAG